MSDRILYQTPTAEIVSRVRKHAENPDVDLPLDPPRTSGPAPAPDPDGAVCERAAALHVPRYYDQLRDGTRYRDFYLRACMDAYAGVLELANAGKITDEDRFVDGAVLWHDRLETLFVALSRPTGGFLSVAAATLKGRFAIPPNAGATWANAQTWHAIDSFRFERGEEGWGDAYLRLPATLTTTRDVPGYDPGEPGGSVDGR